MRFRLLVFIGLLSTLTLHAAELPDYFKDALTRFSPEIPAKYSFTVTTRRGNDVSVERFDPSLPLDQQWTLLQRNQQPATAEENARYRSYRITTAPNVRATFTRANLDLNTFHLVSETPDRAEYRGRFLENVADPLLQRLEVFLTVRKQPALVERCVLQLTEEYSPVLTVKMLELRLETTFSPAVGPDPALPLRTTSRFRGRALLFKSIEEDIETNYTEFAKVVPSRR